MTDFDRFERSRWAGRALAFDQGYARLCAHPVQALMAAAGAAPGMRILDVGTGTGAVPTAAAGIAVVGVDADPGMIQVAATRVPSAAFAVAALPGLPFPDATFDAATANFVINHVGEPRRAVAEMRRVVRPGGRVAVTVWPAPAPPAQALWGQIFADAGVPAVVDAPRVDAGHNFTRTADGLAALLTAAGLTDVRSHDLTWAHRVTPDEWWSGPAHGVATPGLILEQLPHESVARVRASFDRVLAAFRTDDGRLALPTAAVLASGRVASAR